MMAAAQRIPTVSPEQAALLKRRADSPDAELWDLLDQVKDPEIPSISLFELGVLRDIQRDQDQVTVQITPTYSGCPAMETMRDDILEVLGAAGYQATVETVLSPAWSSDWMTPQARENLHQFGIAPPQAELDEITCPYCQSADVERVSEFGSTACKALYRCKSCAEPFDYFKQI